ncbi:anti-sigma factor domain-containing protein [Paraconexibacter sp.]|uniref:anti-sigma factor n=1 Tax=Paraconexibacter sp. TaxID=2949640 RepID=UPI003566D752
MMSRFGFTHSDCDRAEDAGAYVLRALSEDERVAFAAHLETCAACRAEVEELQIVADQLPMAAPQLVPPPELRHRLMSVVESEAELLRAAGPEADRPAPAPHDMRLRDRVWWPSWLVSPGFAAALAACLVLAGVGAGLLVSGGGDGPGPVRTVQAEVTAPGARATVAVQDGKATLRVTGLPAAPNGRVYQVWLMREGTPEPTHTLFSVRPDGRAVVNIDEKVDGVEQILVTAEPSGGSVIPTSAPILDATLA